jgi:hypothetical protein
MAHMGTYPKEVTKADIQFPQRCFQTDYVNFMKIFSSRMKKCVFKWIYPNTLGILFWISYEKNFCN